jgi:hypothetical protein
MTPGAPAFRSLLIRWIVGIETSGVIATRPGGRFALITVITIIIDMINERIRSTAMSVCAHVYTKRVL